MPIMPRLGRNWSVDPSPSSMPGTVNQCTVSLQHYGAFTRSGGYSSTSRLFKWQTFARSLWARRSSTLPSLLSGLARCHGSQRNGERGAGYGGSQDNGNVPQLTHGERGGAVLFIFKMAIAALGRDNGESPVQLNRQISHARTPSTQDISSWLRNHD